MIDRTAIKKDNVRMIDRTVIREENGKVGNDFFLGADSHACRYMNQL